MNDTIPLTDDAAVAAERAAESIRELNYMASEVRDSDEVYEVLGGLVAMAEQLPQTCGQMMRWLERKAENSRPSTRGGQFRNDVPAAVAAASEWLTRAADLAEQLRQALTHAHVTVGGLAHAGAFYPTKLEPVVLVDSQPVPAPTD